MSKIERLRLRDIATLAKVRYDAQRIIDLLGQHRRLTGSEQHMNKYTTQIEERARQIIDLINETNKPLD